MIQISGVFGGGSALPYEIQAGDTAIFQRVLYSSSTTTSPNWETISAKTVEIKKAGTYRFMYNIRVASSTAEPVYVRLSKNGIEVPDSYQATLYISGSYKTIDVEAEAGDIIALQLSRYVSGTTAGNDYLGILILAEDLKEAIDEIVVLAT